MQLKYWIVIKLVLMLTACGQKGALILDNRNDPATTEQQKKPEKSTVNLQQVNPTQRESSK